MYIFHSSDPLLGNHRFSLFLYIKDRNSTIIIFRLCTFSKQPAAPFLNRCGTHPLLSRNMLRDQDQVSGTISVRLVSTWFCRIADGQRWPGAAVQLWCPLSLSLSLRGLSISLSLWGQIAQGAERCVLEDNFSPLKSIPTTSSLFCPLSLYFCSSF